MICIYHDNCMDGFTAAWAVHRFTSSRGVDCQFIPAQYGSLPWKSFRERDELISNQPVFIVDFSFPKPVLDEMAALSAYVVVLDHHKSAAEQLGGYPTVDGDIQTHDLWTGVKVVFDMNRSGAGIAWDFFHPDEGRPPLVNHAEDYDLWRFELDGTRQVNAVMTSHHPTFEVWEELNLQLLVEPRDVIKEGDCLLRKHRLLVDQLVAAWEKSTWFKAIGGIMVPVINCPGHLTSDVGNQLAQNYPFAASYFDSVRGRHYSLRSRKDAVDVAKIAQQYGGGGHHSAAGFTLPHGVEP